MIIDNICTLDGALFRPDHKTSSGSPLIFDSSLVNVRLSPSVNEITYFISKGPSRPRLLNDNELRVALRTHDGRGGKNWRGAGGCGGAG